MDEAGPGWGATVWDAEWKAADKILKGRCGCSKEVSNSRKFPLNPVCCGINAMATTALFGCSVLGVLSKHSDPAVG